MVSPPSSLDAFAPEGNVEAAGRPAECWGQTRLSPCQPDMHAFSRASPRSRCTEPAGTPAITHVDQYEIGNDMHALARNPVPDDVQLLPVAPRSRRLSGLTAYKVDYDESVTIFVLDGPMALTEALSSGGSAT